MIAHFQQYQGSEFQKKFQYLLFEFILFVVNRDWVVMSVQTMYQSLQRKQKEHGSDYAGTREYEFPTFHLLP